MFCTVFPMPLGLTHSSWRWMGTVSTGEDLSIVREGFLEESQSTSTAKVASGPATLDSFPGRMGWMGVYI